MPTMPLDDYYWNDPRVVLVPTEHLAPDGVDEAFANLLREREGWDQERIQLLNTAFALYWTRTAGLAERADSWAEPRARNIALVRDPATVLPYVQMLNNTTWTAYMCDFDPECSNAEFAAYVLAHGDRMFLLGETTRAALFNAPWWFERTTAERAAFAFAAAQSPRPDAEGFRAIAEAIPWLCELHHETLRPLAILADYLPMTGSGLLVAPHLQDAPRELVARGHAVHQATVKSFRDRWREPDRKAAAALCAWLAADRPPLLVTGRGGRILWDPEVPQRMNPLRNELKQATGVVL